MTSLRPRALKSFGSMINVSPYNTSILEGLFANENVLNLVCLNKMF